jgi:hypothetical protein
MEISIKSEKKNISVILDGNYDDLVDLVAKSLEHDEMFAELIMQSIIQWKFNIHKKITDIDRISLN